MVLESIDKLFVCIDLVWMYVSVWVRRKTKGIIIICLYTICMVYMELVAINDDVVITSSQCEWWYPIDKPESQ